MTNKKFTPRKERKAVPAVCKICGKKHYSLTTNYNGLIICASCDRDREKNN